MCICVDMCVCVCVSVCVCKCERYKESVCMCVDMCVCVCVCERVSVCVERSCEKGYMGHVSTLARDSLYFLAPSHGCIQSLPTLRQF